MTRWEIVDLKKTQVAVIILNAFLLELVALLGRELVALPARFGPFGAALVINEQRLAVVWPLPIGPAGHFHLKNAEVDAELQFLAAIESDNFAHFDCAGFMRPIFQERIEIKTHYANNVRNSGSLCQWRVMNRVTLGGAKGAPTFSFAKSLNR